MSKQKVRRGADDIERFEATVAVGKPDECHPWQGTIDKQGRGIFYLMVGGKENFILAHRYAWELKHKRDIPPGWECAQRCQNFACCNPAHLFIREPKQRYLADAAAPDTIHANAEEFLQWMAFQSYAPKTIDAYATSLGKLASWLETNAPAVHRVDGISRHHLRAYIPWLANTTTRKGKRIVTATFAKDVYAVRTMLDYFRSETDLAIIDPKTIRLPRMVSPADRLPTSVASPEEVDRLIASCDADTPIGRRDRAIFALLFSTGLRVHELCALERSSFPRDALGKHPTFSLTVTGKGRHVRIVFVDERAQRFILETLADRSDKDPALFVNFHSGLKQTGRKAIGPEILSPRGVQLAFKRHAEQAGLGDRKLTPHTMRHGLAVDLLEGGADLRTVQDVLGHRSIVTTTVYTKLSNRQLEAGYLKRQSLQTGTDSP